MNEITLTLDLAWIGEGPECYAIHPVAIGYPNKAPSWLDDFEDEVAAYRKRRWTEMMEEMQDGE